MSLKPFDTTSSTPRSRSASSKKDSKCQTLLFPYYPSECPVQPPRTLLVGRRRAAEHRRAKGGAVRPGAARAGPCAPCKPTPRGSLCLPSLSSPDDAGAFHPATFESRTGTVAPSPSARAARICARAQDATAVFQYFRTALSSRRLRLCPAGGTSHQPDARRPRPHRRSSLGRSWRHRRRRYPLQLRLASLLLRLPRWPAVPSKFSR